MLTAVLAHDGQDVRGFAGPEKHAADFRIRAEPGNLTEDGEVHFRLFLRTDQHEDQLDGFLLRAEDESFRDQADRAGGVRNALDAAVRKRDPVTKGGRHD